MARATPSTPKNAYQPAPWEDAFLANLRNSANVRAACTAAQIDRTTAYKRRQSHKTFAAKWDEALDEAMDVLEAAMWKRAIHGTTRHRPIFHQGEKVGEEVITEYSDTLAIFLAKAHRPEVYRDTTRTMNITVTADELMGMSNDDLDELERKLASAR